jgi:phosphoglycerate dehydrogenase-like enzyme
MVNVTIAVHIEEESMKRIKAVSPQIKVVDVADLNRRDFKGEPQAKSEFDAILAETEVLYTWKPPNNLLARSPKLKWIQITSAGADRYLTDEFKRNPVKLVNVSGIHATPIAEFILEMMLMFVKRAPMFFELKQKKEWNRLSTQILRGKTVGIVGMGAIGTEAARLCKAFGMNVIATRRSVKKETRARYVEKLLPATQLPELLKQSDFVVIALPLTRETTNLISDKEFSQMKKSAYIINIGRGPIIDEPAMVRALKGGQIAGAGLDVFATEPLVKESPLWEMPNVIMSHHVSGDRDDYEEQVMNIFCKNLKRYIEGKRLFNIVNKELGY